jgi:translation initiation factor IF-3
LPTKESEGMIIRRCTTISDLMINGQIRDREVRLVGENGEQLGIMSSREALRIAEEADLDLVKIAPKAQPPVCKIVDYGKYRYEQTRREKEAKKKQKTVELKEVRLSPNIDTNDLNTKVNNAKKFITKGNRVKVTLRFRGREMAHVQQSKHILDDFAAMLEDVAVIEKPSKMEGRSMSMVLTEKR